MVNGSPILDDAGNIRGVLATFDDVTELEEKNNQLNVLVDKLKTSTEEVNRQNERLQILAARDPLTNCLNRRSFFERSDAEFDIAVTDKSPISSIMLDIDHFKKVNDNYGHAVGDQVIQLIADQLRSVLRGTDIIGRYGGEEFCVLLPGVDIDQATLLAERLREAIEQFSGASRLPIDGNVTISLGVSTINSDTSNATDLIDQADKGLYASKNNGRNQVTRWDAIDHSKVA
jgi:diguanylate cyclase (GGDEF)-like protein